VKNLTLRQIKIFISASKYMSFARAAEELHITAPAISLQIKEMEEDMGLALFTRENRKISLTTAGEYFLLYARRVSSTLKEASTTMERLRGTQIKALEIGMVSTAEYFVPQILAEFKKDYPNLQIRIEVRNRPQLVDLLRDGEIDLAIMGRPPKEIDTRVEAFASNPHVFIAHPQNPLVGRINVSPEALTEFEMIAREPNSGTRSIMEAYFTEHNISPIISMEMSSNEAIKQSVIANMGISFVSLHTVGHELASKQIIILDIQNTPIVRTWHVVALSKRNASQAAEAFRYFMLEKSGEILNQLFLDVKK
jgi:LysR family transcriptional regulator, low CO2-responsive transcriptional regulator